jgi:hypothetical protein
MEKLFGLIDSIIEDLVNQDSNLENAMLKTQVLAFKLKNDKLKTWVNSELNGYDSLNEVPKFRIVATLVKGDLYQNLGYGASQNWPNAVLPIEVLKLEESGYLREHKFRERISELIQLSKSKNEIIGVLPYSFLVSMSEIMSPWEVVNAWSVLSPSSLTGILSEIKSKLINLLLELKEELGDENIPLMENKIGIDKIIDKNIGVINAENVNISIGKKNVQSLNSGNGNQFQLSSGDNSNQKIDDSKINELLEYILKHLDQLGVTESDKEEINDEVIRAKRQLSKPNPSIPIINQSLNVIYEFLIGITGNAYTEIVLNLISQIASSIG